MNSKLGKNIFQFSGSWHCTNCATCTRAAATVGLKLKICPIFQSREKKRAIKLKICQSFQRRGKKRGLDSKFDRVFRGGKKEQRRSGRQFFPATPIKQVLARTTSVYISLAKVEQVYKRLNPLLLFNWWGQSRGLQRDVNISWAITETSSPAPKDSWHQNCLCFTFHILDSARLFLALS